MIRPLAAACVVLMLAACGQQTEPASTETSTPPIAEESGLTPGTPAPASDQLTAQGYGPLRIGMTRAEVEAAMGADANPNAVGGAEPEVCDQFRPTRAPEGVMVMIENGRLSRISAARPSTLKTDRGFGVGDTATAIEAAYGAQALSQPHKYSPAPAEDIFVWTTGGPSGAGQYVNNAEARGVRYEINGEGRVQIVHVGGPSIQLVEGCS